MEQKSLPKILLSTPFKPFCVDDDYNVSTTYRDTHNSYLKICKMDGPFVINDLTPWRNLHLIADNLKAKVTILEYPSLERFTRELQENDYDYVGFSTMGDGLLKVRKMHQVAKAVCPEIVTIVGGNGVMAIPEMIESFADHNCYGEGIAFFRKLIGQPENDKISHPTICSHKTAFMGMPAPALKTYVVVASLGCPTACDFCGPSKLFNHKRIAICKSGKDIYNAMVDIHSKVNNPLDALKGKSYPIRFLIQDDNFLKAEQAAREFMETYRNEQLEDYPEFIINLIYSDITSLSKFTPEELLTMGVETVWVGIESPSSPNYPKNRGKDIKRLFEEYQSNGIGIVVSFIAGLDHHTEDIIKEDMEFAMGLEAMAYQYLPLAICPGTDLFEKMKKEGRLLRTDDLRYWNAGHYNVRHPYLTERQILNLTEGFLTDVYTQLGPSILRTVKYMFSGFQRHRRSSDKFLRARVRVWEDILLCAVPVLDVAEILVPNKTVRTMMSRLKRDIANEVGNRKAVGLWDSLEIDFKKVLAKWYCDWPMFGAKETLKWYGVYLTAKADHRLKDRVESFWEFYNDRENILKELRMCEPGYAQPQTVKTVYRLGARVSSRLEDPA